MSCELKLPSIISFPTLKLLYLSYVTFSNGDDVDQLFSSLPVLEEPYLCQCKWVNINTIKIAAPALKILLIEEDPDADVARYSGLHKCQVEIFAPNIYNFSYAGHIPKDFSLCNLPFVGDANIFVYIKETYMRERNVQLQQLAMKFLEPLSNVRRITIQGDIGQLLFLDKSLLPHLPIFQNTSSLVLDWANVNLACTTVLNILQIMPNLRALYIDKARCDFVDDDCLAETSLTPCLLLHLCRIEITKINGHEGELRMIEFFLKNARALYIMIVTTAPGVPIKKGKMISERLNMFPIYSPKGCIQIREE